MHGFQIGQVIQLKLQGERVSVEVKNRAYKTDGDLIGEGLVVRLNGKNVEPTELVTFEQDQVVGHEPKDVA